MHFINEVLQYPRFRSCIVQIFNYKYFKEIEDDQKLCNAIEVHDSVMNERQVLDYMQDRFDKGFQDDVEEPQFHIRIATAEDKGVYLIFHTSHVLTDGMNYLMLISKAQDGGEETH